MTVGEVGAVTTAVGGAGDVAGSLVVAERGGSKGGLLPQEVVGSYLDLGGKEATAAQRVYQQSLNSNEPLVIGRLVDTAAGALLGMRRLDDPDWTLNINYAWIQGGANAFKPFYLGSNISFQNLRAVGALYPRTVFFLELQQLRDLGYFRRGDWMLPPPR